MMTSRERVLTAIAHKEPDRVPIDLGGTRVSGFVAVAYHHFRRYCGLREGKVRIFDVFAQLCETEQEILERFHIDVLDASRTLPPVPQDLPDAAAWKAFDLLDLTVTPPEPVPAEIQTSKDIRPDGEGGHLLYDEAGVLIGIKPHNSLYFYAQNPPLANAQTARDIERLWPLKLPSKEQLQLLRASARYLRENTDKAITLPFGGKILEGGQGLRGWEQFMMDLALGEPLLDALLGRLVDHYLEALQLVLNAAGEFIDIIQMVDDMGTQDACQVSPRTYRERLFPCHQTLYRAARDHPSHPHLFLHSCGGIAPLIPYLIEAGVEILNPVQTSATGMDPVKLKQEFGNDITFWGGGCETQNTLPTGTPEQVTDEVKRRIEIFAPGGGFVFNQIQTIQAEVPPENVAAMLAAAYDFGNY